MSWLADICDERDEGFMQNRARLGATLVPIAIPRDLRIAAEEGDLLQDFCELLM